MVFRQIRFYYFDQAAVGPVAARARVVRSRQWWPATLRVSWLDLVVAITAGNYDTPDQGVPPTRVIREVVLPAVS